MVVDVVVAVGVVDIFVVVAVVENAVSDFVENVAAAVVGNVVVVAVDVVENKADVAAAVAADLWNLLKYFDKKLYCHNLESLFCGKPMARHCQLRKCH